MSKGPTYDRKNWLKSQGMRWDAAKKRWWTGKKSTADSVSEGVLEDTVPGSWEFYLEHQPDLDLEAVMDRLKTDVTEPLKCGST